MECGVHQGRLLFISADHKFRLIPQAMVFNSIARRVLRFLYTTRNGINTSSPRAALRSDGWDRPELTVTYHSLRN
jgi:hypothetical protein